MRFVDPPAEPLAAEPVGGEVPVVEVPDVDSATLAAVAAGRA